MALLSTAQLRTYIRASSAEDATIDELRTEALGLIQGELGRPIASGATFGESSRGYRVVRSLRHEDSGGSAAAVAGGTSGALADHPGYATWIEPILNAALRACVAAWAQNRNPEASSEGAAGVSVSYFPEGLPARARMFLSKLQSLD